MIDSFLRSAGAICPIDILMIRRD